MAQTFQHLLSPLTVRGHTYKNRIVSAPMGGVFLENGHADPESMEIIRGKMRGGAAAFIVGETSVSAETARVGDFYDFSDEENMNGLREYASEIKRFDPGAIAILELVHCGQTGEPDDIFEINSMTRQTMETIAAQFAAMSVHAKNAGFDGVMVHMGHRWLFGQFLSPEVNHRSDEFGGSVENRARIAVMTLCAIREACGGDFIIECRISGRENTPGSYTDNDICEYARIISQYADLLHISAGVYRDPMRTLMMSTSFDEHGCNAEIARRIKAAVDIPVTLVGGINSPQLAEQLLEEGGADLIAFGRQMLADPLLPEKAAAGRSAEIKGCLRCMRCFPGPFEEAMEELGGEFPAGCSVNPLYEFPEYTQLPRAESAKRVLVIGGGIAGMQCAVTAAERGHSVTLLEKSGRLGGILNFARNDPHKADLSALADALAAQAEAAGVDIRLNTVLTPELLDKLCPDEVVCAIGSSPLTPPIPGLDGENVIRGIDAYDPDVRTGENVAVLGGGLVGCETAIHLAEMGKSVAIVEMRGELAPDAYRLHKHKLRELIAASPKIQTCLNAVCKEVTKQGVKIEKDGVELLLPADTVVSALGMRANPTGELEQMCQHLPFRKIGDCERARKIYDAVREGFLTAVDL